jgi:glycerol-3-phosphate acyltransferase PlsY
MVGYFGIGLNALFGFPMNTATFKDVFSQSILATISGLASEPCDDWMAMNMLTCMIGLSSIATTLFHIFTVLSKTDSKPAIGALIGLIPVLEWWLMLFCIFGFTEAAWTHTGLVIQGLTCTYSLLNCRQIVTNMSRQYLSPCPWEPLIFLVFPINSVIKVASE